jgi:glycosyltransferase involved in cell wall biosynthesis
MLLKAIDSVLRDGFQDIEIVVSDDGSNDNTEQLIMDLNSPKIRYIHQVNSGVCAARNAGAKIATGQFLVFLDSDDTLSENALAIFHKVLSKGNFKLLLGYFAYVGETGNIRRKLVPEKSEKSFRHPLSGSFALRSDVFRSLHGYDEKLTFSETSDLFLRLAEAKCVTDAEIALTNDAGVHIPRPNRQARKQRYSLKKYESVKYFLAKHEQYFKQHANHFVNFKRIHAMCALQNQKFGEARKCFLDILVRKPFQSRSYFQFFFVLLAPRLAQKHYGR